MFKFTENYIYTKFIRKKESWRNSVDPSISREQNIVQRSFSNAEKNYYTKNVQIHRKLHIYTKFTKKRRYIFIKDTPWDKTLS